MRKKHGNNLRNKLVWCPRNPVLLCCKSDPQPITTQKPTIKQPIISRTITRSELACQNYQNIHKNFSKQRKICQGKNIVFGNNSDINEFPHMAAIGFEREGSLDSYDFDCGGSLISEKFVLTAEHCVNKRSKIPKIVRLGKVKEIQSIMKLI